VMALDSSWPNRAEQDQGHAAFFFRDQSRNRGRYSELQHCTRADPLVHLTALPSLA